MSEEHDQDNEPGSDTRDSGESLVPIARFTSPQYAEMVKEVLEQEGIDALVYSSTGHFGQTGQFGVSSYRPGMGVFTLLVPESKAEYADGVGESMLGEIWSAGRIER